MTGIFSPALHVLQPLHSVSTLSTPPPTTSPPSSPPHMSIPTLATLLLLWGDVRDEIEPAGWFRLFELATPVSWSDTEKIERFQMQLYPGSFAQTWFDSLSLTTATSMAVLRAALHARWPIRKKTCTRIPRAQQQQQLRGLALHESDIGKLWEMDWGCDYT